MDNRFEDYIKKIERDLRGGKATEYTYRGTLELLIESMAKGIQASNDPKHIAVGAPDFIVERRKVPLGYVETKDVGTDLDAVEKSDQMKRYLRGLHNLILTDYVEFRWYVNGVKRLSTHLATRTGAERLVLNPLGAQVMEEMWQEFLTAETPIITTPKELAERLAKTTHFIKEQIELALESGDAEVKQALEAQYQTFVAQLLPALTHKEFADLYAQTVTYGLFAARISAPEGGEFSLEDAFKYLRHIPFLRRLFIEVNEQLDEIEIIRPYLQDIVSLLKRTDVPTVLADFGRRTRTEDPVVHFYETFLAKYDPKLRESRGVYYTPEPVVQFIVRSVDEILKTRFNKPWGLADDSVKVLDPAVGTGTFLYYVIQQIHDEIVNRRGQGGQWAQKSREMLKRLYGFELLMAPYVMSHLKLGLLMKDLGAPLEGKDERVHVYLTNTLEEGAGNEGMLPGLGHGIAQEAAEAAVVKRADDIMVVLGNPPYSGHSANASKDKDGNLNFIGKLLREYYFVDGQPLGERNPKWLQDDYVKFIRYGEWRINKSGKGVLAFITNHGYLDNPTFRGMRQHLMQTFDEIYVLDLHGNSKKKEIAPDGNKDENVFDIQQGVAIIIGIKYPRKNSYKNVINYAGYWGSRNEKYKTLQGTDIIQIGWEKVKPSEPFYLFLKQDNLLKVEYDKFWKITDIFEKKSVGVVTGQDEKVVDFSYNNSTDTARKLSISEDKVLPYQYRPFDKRFIIYDSKVVTRQRFDIMKNFVAGPNYALHVCRQISGNSWCHALVTDFITDDCYVSNITSERGYSFLAFLNDDEIQGKDFLFPDVDIQHRSNIDTSFMKLLKNQSYFSGKNSNEVNDNQNLLTMDVFNYIYAIFYSPTYRARYEEFLKIDFPRIPLTSDKKLFAALVRKGKELVDLHLLKSPKVDEFITSYPVTGDNTVEKVTFTPSPSSPSPASRRGMHTNESVGKVWINKTQFFGGVPEAVWQFKIGGYQVCDKWLKDRKGRALSAQDVNHYQRVVVALHETIRVMKEIDAVIPKWPIE